MKTLPDLAYGPEPWMLFDLYLPDGAPRGTFLWFHGGGLDHGTRRDILFAEDLAAAGFAVASATYRLYPGAHFPEFIEDAADAAAYLHAQGHLAMMLALDRSRLARRGLAPEDFAGFVADSAQLTAHFRVLMERGLDGRLERIDEAAPFFFLGAENVPPPLLLIHYADDIPCRPEQNRLFARNLKVLHPDADLVQVELPGTHTAGSVGRDPDGAFAFVRTFLAWVANR